MITIINYGMGNLGSIQNMLKKIGVESTITSEKETIAKATKIILPGVGAFDKAMENIENLNLIEILNKKAKIEKIPILGICLGMQLLANSSDEGQKKGLGWIEGHVRKFELGNNYRVPHMGWNLVDAKKKHILFENMYEEPRFYFVHSYYFECFNKENIIATTDYGIIFASVVAKDNIMGVQFHPEKSHKFGMKLLENFSRI